MDVRYERLVSILFRRIYTLLSSRPIAYGLDVGVASHGVFADSSSYFLHFQVAQSILGLVIC
jgi:hypothetical protein